MDSKNTQIVIQTRHENNHISSSIRITFKNPYQLQEALKRIITTGSIHGILTCENMEFDLELGKVKFEKNANEERQSYYEKTGN